MRGVSFMNKLNGSGAYKHQTPEPKSVKSRLPKRIKQPPKDLRAITVNGETYLNAKDLCIILQVVSDRFGSLSVINFVRKFIIHLIKEVF